MHGFWTGGYDAYQCGLNEEYAARLKELRDKLATATLTQRDELEQQILELRAWYREQKKIGARSIY